MNRKGFTLVELLAVIIILSLLALIASTTITKLVTASKSELYNTQIELIKVAARTWGEENIDKLPDNGECKYLTLKDLKAYGILDKNIINPKTNKEFSNNMNIKVTSTLTEYGNLNFKYEVDAIDVSECNQVYQPICTLVDDADDSNTITPGDKYQCKVKDDMETGFEDGYYFFVLSQDNDESINLIMERNMYYDEDNDVGVVATETNNGILAWYSLASDSSYGPVTAMPYLHNATKDWTNVPNIKMNYEDENIDGITLQKGTTGYGSIKTSGNVTIITSKNDEETGRIENLKARLPRYDEVYGEGKCLTFSENGKGSCPLWLSNYLNSNDSVTGEGVQNIDGIYGYWTLSSAKSSNVWAVLFAGALLNGDVIDDDVSGVRPVITIPTSQLE